MFCRILAAVFGCLLFAAFASAAPVPDGVSAVVRLNQGCTGFVVQPGMMVTAGHCIDKLKGHEIELSDGSTAPGVLMMFSHDQLADDIAIIRFAPVPGQKVIPLYCGPALDVGAGIYMTGYPGGYGLATVWGRVAGAPRTYPGNWERDIVPINISSLGGFSGSPVMSEETGQIVGILVGSMPKNKTLAMMVPSYRLCEFIGAKYV